MTRRFVLLGLIGAVLLCGCGGKPGGITEPRRFFGMNAQQLPPLLATGRVDLVDRNLAAIRGLGVGFVRSVVAWRQLQPEPADAGTSRFHFEELDEWMALLSRHGLRWDPIVIGAPAPDWAIAAAGRADGCGGLTRQGTGDYTAMIRALAERYGPSGAFWTRHPRLAKVPLTTFEVWNEENLSSFWCPRPDPAAYGRLYAAARAAVHDVIPSATVVLGGLADVPEEQSVVGGLKVSYGSFLGRMLAAEPGLRHGIDAVAFHPYGQTPDDVLDKVIAFRRALKAHGLGDVPILANEYGWPLQGLSSQYPPVSEAVRTRYVADATERLAQSRCGVVGIAPHTWLSRQRDPRSIVDWYGLANPISGVPYPSGAAYGRSVRRIERVGAARSEAHCS